MKRSQTKSTTLHDVARLAGISHLHERGNEIPGQVSVIRFDDSPDGAYFEPALTSVRQDFHRAVREGLAIFVEMVRTPGMTGQSKTRVPELILRSSTGAVSPA